MKFSAFLLQHKSWNKDIFLYSFIVLFIINILTRREFLPVINAAERLVAIVVRRVQM